MADVTRRLAQFLCDQMNAEIPEVPFRPEQGSSGGSTSSPIQMPFGVPLIIEALAVNPPAEVYLVTVHFTFQSMADDSSPEFHSDIVRRMMVTLQALAKVLRQNRGGYDETNKIFLNGMYIAGTRPVGGDQAHTSMVDLKVGCQLRDPVS